MDDDSEYKNLKGTKKCVIKRILTFNDYTDYLLSNKIILELQQRFKSEYYNVYTEGINNIALSSADVKRLHTSDKITTHPSGTNVFNLKCVKERC